ncbi:3-ketoacyl-(acyl-carrier-protein) reductase [Gordonia neofelifaecis NRRL B-59395]|uniref:3-ketoacyl-(Acyl-carrier-protein) reductase n=1 Tax=Gordonia neofelifaecis NRRL B-59395 TaxID=644548 RepID=F1YK69_9ACTN|nr:3-oxoacyl-ACP reductase family protein [Gordonia neofelifaecis]EGD54915.1 3-ketoacyl-(acyl-carrier-protein) reductase [Gordonia neofelifaecis NRRL B-59395]
MITGSGRGLGLAIAGRLGADGAHVWITDVREDWGRAAVNGLRENGITAQFCPVDVRSPESVDAMVEAVAATGPIYGLVNNAALADGVGGKAVHELPVEDWDRVLDVNLRGTFLVSRAVAPHLIDAGGGRIVTIGSDAALYGSARLCHYISSKGGVSALTRAMARDLGPHGITVNTVSPGLTESESAEMVPEHRHELYRRNRALTRSQEPADLVGAVAFLLGDEASYITGQELVVDGGFVFH